MSLTEHNIHYVPNGQGWLLELKQCNPPKKINKNRNPVIIIPGYGMNSFIFGYHPRGLSLEGYMTQRGYEVWSVNLREQGGSKCEGGSREYSLKDLATVDLKAAIEFIVKTSRSETGKVDLIGCSLGGTLAFIYSCLIPKNRTGSLVAIGSPLRWEKVHPLLRIAFASPKLVGLIRLAKTKEILKLISPLIMKSSLMKIYLHKEMVDMRHLELFFETVEDPNRFINRELAQWILDKDLVLDGKNITHEFRKVKNPILCVLSNGDGIVPPLTALSAHEVAGSKVKETLLVGTEKLKFAHADLFISHQAHEMVFKPIADWLLKVNKT